MPAALVTGAARARGIGRATALRLASLGWDVACLDIADDLGDVVGEVEAAGRTAIGVRADVSDSAAVDAAVAEATEAIGTITAVANVAGGSGVGWGVGPIVALPDDEFRRVLDVNLLGTWFVSKACASRMVAAGVGGRIVNVSSQAGKRPFPMLGAYCAAKAAVISLTQCMALELGPSGISVNAVCPGTVDTDLINPDNMMESMLGGPDAMKQWIDREIPLGRLQSADEIAAAITWLLSDDARGITGDAVNVSAGQTMF